MYKWYCYLIVGISVVLHLSATRPTENRNNLVRGSGWIGGGGGGWHK